MFTVGVTQHVLSLKNSLWQGDCKWTGNKSSNVGKDIPVSEDVINDIELFTIHYIYNDKQSMSLSAARAKKKKRK